jgi:hypothetical protein
MAETTFTPGPWTVNKDRRGAGKLYVREAKLSAVAGATAGRAVAQVTAVVGFEEQFANADLIAAAPELLSALAALLPHASEALRVASEDGWAANAEEANRVRGAILDAEHAIAKAEGRA